MKRAIALLSVGLLAGCNGKLKPTPENYLTTINAYLQDHPDCLLDGSIRFPYETSDKAMMKKMDALLGSKLLESHSEPAIHITRYTLTPEGTSAAPTFCFGYRHAEDIVSSTAPAMANGFTETQVVYHYTIRDVAMWAKTPAVMEAFPVLAQERGGAATDRITLALTRVGWSVPN